MTSHDGNGFHVEADVSPDFDAFAGDSDDVDGLAESKVFHRRDVGAKGFPNDNSNPLTITSTDGLSLTPRRVVPENYMHLIVEELSLDTLAERNRDR